jgi:hypothetical protein
MTIKPAVYGSTGTCSGKKKPLHEQFGKQVYQNGIPAKADKKGLKRKRLSQYINTIINSNKQQYICSCGYHRKGTGP